VPPFRAGFPKPGGKGRTREAINSHGKQKEPPDPPPYPKECSYSRVCCMQLHTRPQMNIPECTACPLVLQRQAIADLTCASPRCLPAFPAQLLRAVLLKPAPCSMALNDFISERIQ
jgi:hypothetical protein